MVRRASKIDQNQHQIIEAFESHGCAVKSTAGLGDGFPDLVVFDGKQHHLVEVKMPKGKLRESQITFIDAWAGPVHIVRSPIEVLALVQEWRKQ